MMSRRNIPGSPEEAARLAHELANLLDGSLRHVGLALHALGQSERGMAAPGPADEEALVQRLTTARDAMQQMAQLIHRWLRESRAVDSLYQHSRTLGQSVTHALALMQPVAGAQQVVLNATVSDQAARLPSGPLDPVLINGLRNSLEAMTALAPQQTDLRIDVIAAIERDELVLTIRDSGPGLSRPTGIGPGPLQAGVSTKPGGHGLGLSLCREIVLSLGGTLTLTNRADGGRGAELRVQVPITALVNPGEGI